MLEINNLWARTPTAEVLKGINLTVNAGEVHAIMGPNGSGKSTLSKVIAGHPDYEVTQGTVTFDINLKQKDLLALSPDERAREGIFLSFQYPVEIPGVSNLEFLRAAFNSITAHQGGEEMDVMEFQDFVKEKCRNVGFDEIFLTRQLNVDFSGGEKKRNEVLQMVTLSPRLALLDEVDSGLDVDSLRQISHAINTFRNPSNAVVLITHYQRILDYVTPDHVHILYQGKIVKSGDHTLAKEVEERGYDPFI